MITLINPNGIKTKGLQVQGGYPPIGLAYLAGQLKRGGYPYQVIDAVGLALDNYKALSRYPQIQQVGLEIDDIVNLISAETKCIGLSAYFSSQWPALCELSFAIRKRFPKIPIILGGEHGTALPEESLKTSPIDFIALGEGDETILDLAKADYKDINNIPGMCYLNDGKLVKTSPRARITNLKEIALPDWDSFPLENYFSNRNSSGTDRGRSMLMLATRGCPYQCTFCSNDNMYGQRYLERDPVDVVNEMELYVKKYKVQNIDLCDLTTIINRRWGIALCKELIQRNLNITFQMPTGTRAEAFNQELAELLFQAGCRNFAFAPESGDNNILKLVKKKVNLEKLEQAIHHVINAKINLSCFFVYGFPQDTKESIRNSIRLARKFALWGVHDFSISRFLPYPGSELSEELYEKGKFAYDEDYYLLPVRFRDNRAPNFCDNLSSNYLHWITIYTYINFYLLSFFLRPHRPIINLIAWLTTGVETTRYIKLLANKISDQTGWRVHSYSKK